MKITTLLMVMLLTAGLAYGQGTGVRPGTGAANAGKAEDAVHTSGDVGYLSMGVRNNAGTALAADGDYIPMMFDTDGKLYVNASCSVGGGTEDAAETEGGTLSMSGAVVRAGKTGSSATAADNATLNVTTTGGLWGASDQIEDAAETAATPLAMAGAVVRAGKTGSTATAADNATLNVTTEGGLWGASDQIEDAAETADQPLQMVGSVRRDTAASSAGTTGDNATLNTDANGRLWTIQAGLGTEDVAETADGPLQMVGSVRRDTMASSAGATGDNATLNTNAIGALYTIGTGAATLTCAQVDVPTSGTAVQLAGTTCKTVTVSCESGNTSSCWVRADAGNGVTGGMEIAKGTRHEFAVSNANVLWVDAGTNGDDVGWCCTN